MQGKYTIAGRCPDVKYILRGDEKWILIVLWNDTICYPDEGPEFSQKAWLQLVKLEKLLTVLPE